MEEVRSEGWGCGGSGRSEEWPTQDEAKYCEYAVIIGIINNAIGGRCSLNLVRCDLGLSISNLPHGKYNLRLGRFAHLGQG